MQITSIFQTIVSIFMALISSLTASFGVLGEKIVSLYDYFTQPAIIQDFEEQPEGTIRIMSFNVRYGDVGSATREDREPLVSETIRKGNPDSVGLQEATYDWIAYLSTELGDTYSYVGVGRDNGETEGEYAAIFYRNDKYTVVDSGTFWLSETPDVPSKGWNAGHYRICTWAVLENIGTGEQYVHLNSHFDNASAESRSHSVDMILDKAAEYTDLPVVFTADMNVNEGSEDYVKMTSGSLRDTKHAAADTMDYLTYHDTTPVLHTASVIDYVMINSNFDAVSYRVVTAGVNGEYVSDHFPIYADIKFAD